MRNHIRNPFDVWMVGGITAFCAVALVTLAMEGTLPMTAGGYLYSIMFGFGVLGGVMLLVGHRVGLVALIIAGLLLVAALLVTPLPPLVSKTVLAIAVIVLTTLEVRRMWQKAA